MGDRVKDETIIELIRASVGADKHVFKRPTFERNKFTVDLLGMAHYYEVKDLLIDCAEHLKENIADENVMKVWTEAEKFEITTLYSKALEHLAERPVGKPLKEVPGFEDAFKDLNKPIKDLLDVLSIKISSLKKKYEHLEEGQIEITIKSTVTTGLWSVPHSFYVKEYDKVASLIQKLPTKYRPPIDGKLHCLTRTSSPAKLRVESDLTFAENGIYAGGKTTLYVWHTLIANAW